MPFGLHGFDLIALVIVALLVFGPKRLPQMGAAIGQTFQSFKQSMTEIGGDHQLADAPREPQIAAPLAATPANEEPSATITRDMKSR